MACEFWLSDEQWATIAPLLPTNGAGARRVDDRRVISGIIHVLKSGCRWQDCPSVYGPYTTIYNRFHRWSGKRIWHRLLAALTEMDGTAFQAIDSTSSRAHRSAAGGKWGRTRRQLAGLAVAEPPRSTSSPTNTDGR